MKTTPVYVWSAKEPGLHLPLRNYLSKLTLRMAHD